jgi:hypothetical protein
MEYFFWSLRNFQNRGDNDDKNPRILFLQSKRKLEIQA